MTAITIFRKKMVIGLIWWYSRPKLIINDERFKKAKAADSFEPPWASGQNSAGRPWSVELTDDCLDDVTLPPGGGSIQLDPAHHSPHPDYLSHEGRDLRIDLLRGFFVLAMVIDHVRGQSFLYLLTGGNRFYTSAAEGFILTSGLVAGIVYRRLIQRDGMSAALLKVLHRAFTLYLLTVGLTLVFTLFSELLGLPWVTGVSLADPIGWVVSVFTLHQTYYLVDVMLLYTVLFLISPLAFILLDRGKTWLLLLGSAGLYLVYQFYPDYASLPWPIAGNYLFNFSAWQIIFFAGLALGYNQQRLPALNARKTCHGLILTGLGFLLLIGVFLVVDTPTTLLPEGLSTTSLVLQNMRVWLQDNFFAKVDAGPGRLITSAVVFSFFFLVVTRFWPRIQKWLGWLLLPLGQHSLNAYSAHIAVVGLVGLALLPFKLDYPGPEGLNAVIQIASILVIWFVVKRRLLAPTTATRKWWNLSPAVIGLAIILVLLRFPAPTHPGQAAAVQPQSNVPTRYGTPVPKTAANAPIPAANAAPAPTPALLVHTAPGSDVLVSDYLTNTLYGSALEHKFYSSELDREMPYNIYLPPDYTTSTRRYPVLYMLHGLGGQREEWIVYGLFNVIDSEIHTGDIPPMIVVLPQGDKGYWVDNADDGPRWGEYLSHDLVNIIDTSYRTLRTPEARAIGGLSMGGYGALYQAFTHPDIFGVVGAHSPSLHVDDGSTPLLGIGQEFNLRDPLYLAANMPNLTSLQVWLDSGDEDEWTEQAIALDRVLEQQGIPHTFQEYPGGHDYDYWTQHLIDYLRFYATALTPK
jgi:enterochelin esterase-like enzyme